MTVSAEPEVPSALLHASSPPPNDALTQARPSEQGVSIVIPAYNESDGIEGSLRELLDCLAALKRPIPYEIILVDDASSDDTAEKAARFADEGVHILRKERNGGYGAAIKTGAHRAQYPWIAITDADGTYAPEHFEELFARRDEHHMVVGARTTEGAAIPLIRRPAKWVLRKLASVLIQQRIPDLNSGQRVMLKSIFTQYERILPNQFSLTTTITLVMFACGYSVDYVPVQYRRRHGSSKIHPIRDVIGFLVLIIRTIIYFNPLRVFVPLSLLFLAASLTVALVSIYFGRFMDVSSLLLFVTGVQLGAIGILADAINLRRM